MEFMVKDDTTGNYWYNLYTVPSENVLLDGNCFSPAVAVETYMDPATTSLTNVPFFQFFEGNDIGDKGSVVITGASNQFVNGQFFNQSTGTGDWSLSGRLPEFCGKSEYRYLYWTLFQVWNTCSSEHNPPQ